MISLLPKLSCRASFTAFQKLSMSSTNIADEKIQNSSLKRDLPEKDNESSDGSSDAKKPSLENAVRIKKRKYAMMIAYQGSGYLGLQRNPGRKTIEEDLMVGLLKGKLIDEESFNQPQLLQFQRAARTDKGVSALRQIISLRLPENSCPEEVNSHLPEQVRVIALKRVTRGFNSKSNCDGRTYSYLSPTFAFSPNGTELTESYRLQPEVQSRISEVLNMFVGTHNFHNFTSKKLPTDPSSSRYIVNFTCDDPFVVDGLEFVKLQVRGQSFMLHQIRKMVGLTIAIVRGLTTTDTLTRAWDRDRLDLPVAPGLGLLLEEVHYDRYNQRYGNDGMHETLDWKEYTQEVEEFNRKYILPAVVETEKNEKSMMNWLETLQLHTFDIRNDHIHAELDEALKRNEQLLAPSAHNNLETLLKAAHAVEAAR